MGDRVGNSKATSIARLGEFNLLCPSTQACLEAWRGTGAAALVLSVDSLSIVTKAQGNLIWQGVEQRNNGLADLEDLVCVVKADRQQSKLENFPVLHPHLASHMCLRFM